MGTLRRGGWGAAVLAGLLGCGSEEVVESPAVAERSDALGPSEACPGLRWIGTRNPALDCPPSVNAGWNVSRLIGDPAAPPDVRKFCLYEWTDSTTPAVADLPFKSEGGTSYPPGEWLDPDCFVVAGQSNSSDVEDILRPILADAHAAQVEMPPAPVASPPGGGTDVRVAIVDTWAYPTNQGRSQHGFAMAGIIETLACGSLSTAPCPIKTTPHLALDRYGESYARDPVHGGTYGAQGNLARAIYQAVDAPGAGKRIVNLSVGWDDRYNVSTAVPGQDSYPVQAVQAVLEHAACEGALVIASAGNATGGPAPGTGPVYPGAWQQTPAPPCVGALRPLVYSVGGVDGYDEPLPNARPGGRPVAAAPSFAVPSTNAIGGTVFRMGPFSGSSVSAAVGSAAAALVWHFDGALQPHDVVATIAASAQLLPDAADYCLTSPCGTIRRISICDSLAAAGAAIACGAVQIGAGAGVNPSYSAATLAQVAAIPHTDADGTGLTAPLSIAECSMPVKSLSPAPQLGPTELCPSETLESDLVVPSIDPQPGTDPCPDCNALFEPNSTTVDLPISDLIDPGIEVIPQTLTLLLGGAAQERYDLGSAVDTAGFALRDGLTPGQTYRVELPATALVYRDPYPTGFDAVSIEWTRVDAFTTSYLVVTAP